MSTIPKRLRPWATELALVHTTCWPLLGQWLPLFDGALFRQAAGVELQRTTPDGFEGLSYQGDFNRLLATEWALLNFHSDEFYRRTTMGESQFLKLAYPKKNQPQGFYLLLDRGPDQYGAPFLLQLALLFVLWRRAREKHLPLNVGFLQEPGEWIVASRDTVEHRIHCQVSHARLIPKMVEAWRKHLTQYPVDQQAIWSAASPRNAEQLTFGQCLLIDSDRQSDGRIDVLFRPRQQRLKFYLQDDDVTLRLLRRPFISTSQQLTGSSQKHCHYFCLHPVSRKYFFSTGEDLLTYYIPKHPSQTRDQPKRYKQRIKNILIGIWHSKSITATITTDGTMLYCTGFFQQAKFEIPLDQLPQPFEIPDRVSPLSLAYVMRHGQIAKIIIKDGANHGFQLKFLKLPHAPVFEFDAATSLGIIAFDQFLIHAYFYTDGEQTLSRLSADTHYPKTYQLSDRIQGIVQRTSQIEGRTYPVLPLLKNCHGDWTDELLDLFPLNPEDKPIGAFKGCLIVQRGEFQFYLLKPNQDTLELPAQLILETSDALLKVVYRDQSQWIAYQTSHVFKVYDMNRDTEIMTMELTHAV